MIKIRWPDGEFTTGESWREILEALRQDPWSKILGRRGFRLEMATRAYRWAGRIVSLRTALFGNDEAFGRALARAGLYTIMREDGRSGEEEAL